MSIDGFRKMIAVDFDGVLHSYSSGWKGADVIPDAPNPGAMGWLVGICLYSPYDVGIYSARTNSEHEGYGAEAMLDWLHRETYDHMFLAVKYQDDEGFEKMCDDHASVMANITILHEKPPQAFIFIDDRAFKFQGTFPSLTELEHFKPWYK